MKVILIQLQQNKYFVASVDSKKFEICNLPCNIWFDTFPPIKIIETKNIIEINEVSSNGYDIKIDNKSEWDMYKDTFIKLGFILENNIWSKTIE